MFFSFHQYTFSFFLYKIICTTNEEERKDAKCVYILFLNFNLFFYIYLFHTYTNKQYIQKRKESKILQIIYI